MTQLAKIDTIKALLVQNKDRIATALPKHINADRMIRVTLNCLEAEPQLLACSPNSLYRTVIEAATYGWEIGGPLADAYIVPFKNTATLIPGYRGLINLVLRSGRIKEIVRQVVREGDAFSISPLDDPPITHRLGATRGELTFVYCCARFHDGTLSQPFSMSRAEIEAHMRRYAKGYTRDDSPWKTSFDKMALKTCIRQFIYGGYVPTSAEIMDFAMRESVIEGSTVKPKEYVEPEPVEPIALAPPVAFKEHDDEEKQELVTADGEIIDGQQLWPAFENALHQTGTLKAVKEVEDKFGPHFEGEDLAACVELCEAKRQDIRAKRGERANA